MCTNKKKQTVVVRRIVGLLLMYSLSQSGRFLSDFWGWDSGRVSRRGQTGSVIKERRGQLHSPEATLLPS